MGLSDDRRGILIVLLTGGFLVRIAFTVFHQLPLFSDQIEYHDLAVSLVEEQSYSIADSPTAYRPPGYPLFLSVLYWLFGANPLIAKVVQSMLDTVTALLLVRLGNRVRAGNGLFVCAVWLFFPPAILYTNLLMSETLTAFLLTAACLLLIEEKRGRGKMVFLGAVIGFLTLVKPWMGLLAVAIPLLLRRGTPQLSQIPAFVSAFLLVIMPWLVRNFLTFDVVSISTNSGINLFIGNNPNATGGYLASFPDELWAENEIVRDQKARALAFDYIQDDPLRFLVNGVKKIARVFGSESEVLVWSFAENPHDHSVRFAEKYRSIPVTPLMLTNIASLLVLIAGLFGLLTAEKDLSFRFTVIVVIITMLVHFVTFGGSRFHFLLMPFFALFGGVALKENPWSTTSKNKKSIFLLLVSSLLAVWVYELTSIF